MARPKNKPHTRYTGEHCIPHLSETIAVETVWDTDQLLPESRHFPSLNCGWVLVEHKRAVCQTQRNQQILINGF